VYKEEHINSVQDLIDCSKNSNEGWLFRGQPEDYSNDLRPRIGRIIPNTKEDDTISITIGEQIPFIINKAEKKMLSEFKDMYHLYLEGSLKEKWLLINNEVHYLMIAQHYGMKTRLLDWTSNILVAAYFALEKENKPDWSKVKIDGDEKLHYSGKDRTIWVINFSNEQKNNEYKKSIEGRHDVDELLENDPNILCYLKPPLFDDRIINQSSVFTYHGNPQNNLLDYTSNNNIEIIALHKSRKC